MIYDAQGREIEETEASQPRPGLWCQDTTADMSGWDASRGLTPARLDSILTAANAGDIEDQSKLAAELEEKNHDIAQALQTRRLAVLGCPWSVEPGDEPGVRSQESGASKGGSQAAQAFDAALKAAGASRQLDTFPELVADMLGALVPGFAASEIVWGKGGELLGFKHLEQRHFNYRDGQLKFLPDDNSAGVELPEAKLIFRRARVRSGLACRDGLVRPLAWLHTFSNLNLKDLLGFIERYGMPFLVAKVDQKTWENERAAIQALIRNFGPSGGGVFTRAVEMELLQASNNVGEVYFKLLEYCRIAIEKLILGQTASSGDSSGLSRGDAQSQVRQDILEADCRAVEDCVNACLAPHWTRFNHGPNAPVPRLKINCEPPEDLQAFATIVKTLAEAGFEADEAEMSERFGLKLTRRPSGSPQPPVDSSQQEEKQKNSPRLRASAVDSAALSDSEIRNSQFVIRNSPTASAVDSLVDNALESFVRDGAEKWAGKILDGFDSAPLAETFEQNVYAAAANGAASEAATLHSKEGKGS